MTKKTNKLTSAITIRLEPEVLARIDSHYQNVKLEINYAQYARTAIIEKLNREANK